MFNKTNFNITLKTLDLNFFKTISGHDQVLINVQGVYHTIIVNGEKAGNVGFIPKQNSKGEKIYLVQIVLLNEFRGKGITKLAEDLLAEKYHLPHLYATIEKSNIASIKAHLKAGFQEVDKITLNTLYKNGFIKKGQTRLLKEYTI